MDEMSDQQREHLRTLGYTCSVKGCTMHQPPKQHNHQRRTVAVGGNYPGHRTLGMTYDQDALAEGVWQPQADPSAPELDHDLIRKQRIEDELAGDFQF